LPASTLAALSRQRIGSFWRGRAEVRDEGGRVESSAEEETGDDASPDAALIGDGALDAGGSFFMGRLIKSAFGKPVRSSAFRRLARKTA